MTPDQINERAWSLWRQLRDQRAVLRSRQDALEFVRVRQMEARDTVEPITDKLWEIAERMHGDMNPTF